MLASLWCVFGSKKCAAGPAKDWAEAIADADVELMWTACSALMTGEGVPYTGCMRGQSKDSAIACIVVDYAL